MYGRSNTIHEVVVDYTPNHDSDFSVPIRVQFGPGFRSNERSRKLGASAHGLPNCIADVVFVRFESPCNSTSTGDNVLYTRG
ncbi:hypothetical protein LMH87_005747 [Akanthomyces muscarius]|uniref:Uncharacterized protein n=1 Tax=Akanthomyces muscarius TaxID=2231603 RepID=A0A9W8QPF3_AKAMU|nr:hypothetical protein LMH87_005747 [Akanthomyces muscarius]KAJ4164059.1 hypothetical protein LMH87_005747 [Akanthomyces muscarius]